MSLYLTRDEIIETTGRKRVGDQAMALSDMGWHFEIRPVDGFPLVLRDYARSRWEMPEDVERMPELRLPVKLRAV